MAGECRCEDPLHHLSTGILPFTLRYSENVRLIVEARVVTMNDHCLAIGRASVNDQTALN